MDQTETLYSWLASDVSPEANVILSTALLRAEPGTQVIEGTLVDITERREAEEHAAPSSARGPRRSTRAGSARASLDKRRFVRIRFI